MTNRKVLLAITLVLPLTCYYLALGQTQFGDSLSKGDLEGVRAALKAGADPNELYDGKGLSALNRAATSVMRLKAKRKLSKEEIERKVIQILDALFEAGARITNHDRAILHAPVIIGHPKIIEYLIKKGADINGEDADGDTNMSLAIEYGHPEIVALLKKCGAKELNSSEIIQIKFVKCASQEDIRGMQRLFHQGAKVNGRTPDGTSVLAVAVNTQNDIIIRWLLEKGTNPNSTARGLFMEGPPLWLVMWENEEGFNPRVAELLIKHGARVSATDEFFGQTPLHIAAQFHNAIATKLLIDAGAKVMPRDKEGKTPLDYAEDGRVIKLLKAAGAFEQ